MLASSIVPNIMKSEALWSVLIFGGGGGGRGTVGGRATPGRGETAGGGISGGGGGFVLDLDSPSIVPNVMKSEALWSALILSAWSIVGSGRRDAGGRGGGRATTGGKATSGRIGGGGGSFGLSLDFETPCKGLNVLRTNLPLVFLCHVLK